MGAVRAVGGWGKGESWNRGRFRDRVRQRRLKFWFARIARICCGSINNNISNKIHPTHPHTTPKSRTNRQALRTKRAEPITAESYPTSKNYPHKQRTTQKIPSINSFREENPFLHRHSLWSNWNQSSTSVQSHFQKGYTLIRRIITRNFSQWNTWWPL